MISFDTAAWLKLIHLFGAFSWMAGLFYLPRILVYQREAEALESRALLAVMARRLYRIIILPASHITIICGLALWWVCGHTGPWIHAKVACVALLYVFQLSVNRFRMQLAINPYFKSSRFFRWVNEVPTLILIGILYCVIFKP